MEQSKVARVAGDPVRSALAAVAAIFAVMGAVASNADHGMMGWELGARVFPAEALDLDHEVQRVGGATITYFDKATNFQNAKDLLDRYSTASSRIRRLLIKR